MRQLGVRQDADLHDIASIHTREAVKWLTVHAFEDVLSSGQVSFPNRERSMPARRREPPRRMEPAMSYLEHNARRSTAYRPWT
ncbi:hypothetical protein SAMN04488498_1608 [Mesorhizobium albiziae]|uniref:Uncharacterized protein n=1 Tax=Neomesorhizobium albiziae TaxID=335020 RepID=A0A1I4FU30_9HYPH|nr:hypothetical protein SAMN04488498_1608 [Mesorhizobium albiziae]